MAFQVPRVAFQVPRVVFQVPCVASQVPQVASQVPQVALSGLPGALSGLPGALSGLPGASDGLQGASSSHPGASSGCPEASSVLLDTSSGPPVTPRHLQDASFTQSAIRGNKYDLMDSQSGLLNASVGQPDAINRILYSLTHSANFLQRSPGNITLEERQSVICQWILKNLICIRIY